MKLNFTKMQGLGNDFVVIDGVRQKVKLSPAQNRWIADRHFGVGCDQILLVEAASNSDNDFRYRIFNSDGGEVEQCGNGARCFVRFVREQGLTQKTKIRVETMGGVIVPELCSDGTVQVDMGLPVFEPGKVPFLSEKESIVYEVEVEGVPVELSVLSMGNPHAVQLVEAIDFAPVQRQGAAIEGHGRFPARVNAGFMEVIDRGKIRLRVFERGAGETLACGTGACAAVVAGIRRGLLDNRVQVETRGGMLGIEWEGMGSSVKMRGPAETVFSGSVEIV